jgi:subfamily B ATP-binding cassette protein MsbA
VKKNSLLFAFLRSVDELRALFKVLEVDSRKLLLSAFVLLLANFATYGSTHLFVKLIHCLTTLKETTASAMTVRNIVLFLVAMKAASVGFTYISSLLIEKENQEVDSRVRSKIFEKLMSFGKAYYDKNSVPKVNQLVQNVSQKSGERLRACHSLLSSFLKLIVIFVFLFKVFWIPATMVVISVVVTIFVSVRSQVFYRVLANRIKDAGESLDEKMLNLLQGHALVKISNTEAKESRRFARLAKRSAKFRTELFKFDRLLSMIGEGSFLGQTLLLAAMTPWLLQSGDKSTIGKILTFFLIMRPVESTVIKLSRSFTLMTRTSGVYSSLERLLEIESKTYVLQGGKQTLDSLNTEIEFRNLSFCYPNLPEQQVIHNFSLTVQKNEWVALIGENGSGKSTLVHLLTGMYRSPKESIFINADPIEKYTSQSLRAQFAVVSQHPIFLDSTITNALSYGAHQRFSEERMMEVIEKVSLKDWILSLPHGFETRIGAGGIQPSGGERQKLAIARALLSQGQILILDEATSAIDPVSKIRIMKTLREECAQRTVLMITHDLEDAGLADRTVSLSSLQLFAQVA